MVVIFFSTQITETSTFWYLRLSTIFLLPALTVNLFTRWMYQGLALHSISPALSNYCHHLAGGRVWVSSTNMNIWLYIITWDFISRYYSLSNLLFFYFESVLYILIVPLEFQWQFSKLFIFYNGIFHSNRMEFPQKNIINTHIIPKYLVWYTSHTDPLMWTWGFPMLWKKHGNRCFISHTTYIQTQIGTHVYSTYKYTSKFYTRITLWKYKHTEQVWNWHAGDP